MTLDTIRVFAISKLGWIKQQQRKLREQERETPREYLNLESHYLWGKRYLLRVIEGTRLRRSRFNTADCCCVSAQGQPMR
jgi:predicted metal-dependent hydrolase